MRKFSTYDGLYTNKPNRSYNKVNISTDIQPALTQENYLSEPLVSSDNKLSAKAIKCYSAIKQHDELVKSLLNK